MVLILNGKQLSHNMADKITQQINKFDIQPHLAIILVGNNPASEIYVRNKMIYAQNVNINSQLFQLPPTTTKKAILNLIQSLNDNQAVNGIIVQSPLPDKSFQEEVFESIDPQKDVDGFTSANIGALCNGKQNCLMACTPLGIWEMLIHYNIPISGKHVVILGRSRIVGRPLSILLSQTFEKANATVTLCNSQTKNLSNITKSADILISAIGKPKFVTKNMIKDGAVIVDVGINRISDEKYKNGYYLCGDVDFKDVYDHCSAISPVPGGVGPMTIAMLMHNTLKAYSLQHKKSLTFYS